MIRRLYSTLAVLALSLLPSLASADVIRFVPPAGTYTGGAIASPILAPAADNCASVPYSFTSDATTGICSSAVGTINGRVSGVNVVAITSTGLAVTGTITTTAGPRYIAKAAPNAATASTAEEVLYTVTVPANTLTSDGDSVSIFAHATTANNANAKAFRVRSGTTVAGTSIAAGSTSTALTVLGLNVTCVRLTSSTMTCAQPYVYVGTGVISGSYTPITGLDFTSTVSFVATGTTTTAAGDLTLGVITAFVSN